MPDDKIETASWSIQESEEGWMVVHPSQSPVGPLRRQETALAVCRALVLDEAEEQTGG